MKQSNYEKVLDVFFDNPIERFYVREVARMTGLNPNTVLNVVGGLIKEGLVKREKKRHIVELSTNVDSKEFKLIKKIRNLSRVLESGVVEFLSKKFDAEAIVLIGGFSRGDDIKESDIDIVVISKKDYESISLNNFEKKLRKKIHLILVYYDKMSDEFYTNLINGIILEGYVKKK